jgi:hypothetical protein
VRIDTPAAAENIKKMKPAALLVPAESLTGPTGLLSAEIHQALLHEILTQCGIRRKTCDQTLQPFENDGIIHQHKTFPGKAAVPDTKVRWK